MPPEKIDRYNIIEELGRGGMAIVYQATDPRFDRQVAIKVLPRQFTHDPKFQVRFDREARTIASLEHPAIVPVYDFGEYDDQPFLVMRYMSGSSLADRILKDGKISLAEAVEIFERLCPALEEAHRRKIIHRDLKPGNILFDHLNKAYLADFGIVKLAEETASFTGTAIVGTPAYMSPEQVQGQKVTSAIDIYSLGCMLFEMLTARPPFLADTTMAVAFKHVHEPVPDIRTFNPRLPEDIQHVVAIAMAKKPEDRFDNANDIPLALRDLLKAQTIDREPTIEVLTMIDVASGVTDETEIEAWDEPQEKEVLKSKEPIERLDSEEDSLESPKIVHVGSYPIYNEIEVENLTEPTSTSESVSGDVIESEGLQESQEEAVDKDSIEQDATQIVMASIRPRETIVNELPESPISESTENEKVFQPNRAIPRWLIAIAAIAAILMLIMFGSFWRTNRGQPAEPAVIPIAEEPAVWEEVAEEEWDPTAEAEAEADIIEPEIERSFDISAQSDLGGMDWVEEELFRIGRAEEDAEISRHGADGELLESVILEGLEFTDGLAFDGQYLWFVNTCCQDAHGLYYVDPETLAVAGQYPELPGWGNLNDVTFDGELLWIASIQPHRLYKVDPQTGVEVGNIEGPIPPSYDGPIPDFDGENDTELYLNGIAWDGDWLWVSELSTHTVMKLDPYTGEILEWFVTENRPDVLAWKEQQLYVGSYNDIVDVYTP